MRDHAKGGALTEVSFHVLLALWQPRHGYAVMQFVEETTGGRLRLGAGTLYGALTALMEKGWIAPMGEACDRRKIYQITPLGRDVARQELARLRALTQTAGRIMGGDADA